jgi:hypothetical protein
MNFDPDDYFFDELNENYFDKQNKPSLSFWFIWSLRAVFLFYLFPKIFFPNPNHFLSHQPPVHYSYSTSVPFASTTLRHGNFPSVQSETRNSQGKKDTRELAYQTARALKSHTAKAVNYLQRKTQAVAARLPSGTFFGRRVLGICFSGPQVTRESIQQEHFLARVTDVGYTLEVEVMGISAKWASLSESRVGLGDVDESIQKIKERLAPQLVQIYAQAEKVKNGAQKTHLNAIRNLEECFEKFINPNQAYQEVLKTNNTLQKEKKKVSSLIKALNNELIKCYKRESIKYTAEVENAFFSCLNSQDINTASATLSSTSTSANPANQSTLTEEIKTKLEEIQKEFLFPGQTIDDYNEKQNQILEKKYTELMNQLNDETKAKVELVKNAPLNELFQLADVQWDSNDQMLLRKIILKGSTELRGFVNKNVIEKIVSDEKAGRSQIGKQWSNFDLYATNIISSMSTSAKSLVVEFINHIGYYSTQRGSNPPNLKQYISSVNQFHLINTYNTIQRSLPQSNQRPFNQVVLALMRTSNTFRDLHGINVKSNFHEIHSILSPNIPLAEENMFGTQQQRDSRVSEKTEIHHIVLNTLGGLDNEWNGVCLTPSEHCIVHLAEELTRLGSGKGSLTANTLAAGGGTGNKPKNELKKNEKNRNRLQCVFDVTVPLKPGTQGICLTF